MEPEEYPKELKVLKAYLIGEIIQIDLKKWETI